MNAFSVEVLRVEAEAANGAPPDVIEEQRVILVDGHVQQFIEMEPCSSPDM